MTRRVLVREPLEPVDHPPRDVVEGGLVGIRKTLTLDPRVERDDVHPLGAALVSRACDLARQLLLARVRRDADDLPGLHVRAVPDHEVREATRRLGVVGHRLREGSEDRMRLCA